ncbi:MAG: beta-N-acetylhexosaminidase [Neisseria sp.]|nr:beta-N-acetylhexosaminidase [Neisseria sp.]
MKPVMPLGPVMADVQSHSLDDAEKQRLLHPAIGGVILFRRNFQNPVQLRRLTGQIKALRSPELIVAVDHEGGRVQRFIQGFTRLPAMGVLGRIWDTGGAEEAQRLAEAAGWVLAAELAACGIDLSFAPVLDLDWGRCAVIGNRSFHHDADVVAALASALQRGMRRGGMKSCGKHFPGHGFAGGDSHTVLPVDSRPLREIEAADLRPFAALSAAGMAAVMPAHVVYERADSRPAGFSPFWLQEILRQKLGFRGVVFSDDLTMEGAASAGGIRQRAKQAFEAGCDIVLVCNRPDLADELLEGFSAPPNPSLAGHWQNMAAGLSPRQARIMMRTGEFQAARQAVSALSTPQDTAQGPRVGEAY